MSKLFSAGRSEPIILQLAVSFLRHFPLGTEPTLALHAMQGGIERAVLHLQDVIGGSLNVLCDLMAVGRAKDQGTENQHVEHALQEIGFVGNVLGNHDSRYSTLA